MMATSVKSKVELEQIALAMMMMAGGEGAAEGVKTRSSTSRKSLEPVSSNCLNNNKNKNHDQPGSPEENEDLNPPDQSPDSANELVIQEEEDEALVCAVNPIYLQSSSPGSPTGSQKSANSGSGSGNQVNNNMYMSSSRRIFKPEFKQKVLDAFSNDPECVGNQRATARKFGIHRRQVQKWLQQLATGELSFNESFPNDDSSESSELRTTKIISTSTSRVPPNRFTSRSKTISKAITRRSAGGNFAGVHKPHTINPSSRASRTSARNRGKSMPLKGGSKSSHFIPTIIHPSSSSSVITPTSLLNLSKSSKHTGKNGIKKSYYINESNGNGTGGSNGGSNMFMNMSSLLASAAAAGNYSLPLSLDNSKNFSPRDHSPINGRGSPAHSAGGSSGGSQNSNLQNALLLVDELNYLYPYSDFSLLRKALLKEEVSLEKLAHPLFRKSEYRMSSNGINSDLSHGLKDLRRPLSPTKSSSSTDYNTQQTLDIFRQQQEYLAYNKLLQLSGIGSPGEGTSGLNLSDLSNNGRLPSWFSPFAAASGLPVPSTSKYVNGSNGNENRRKASSSETNDNHRFASPRIPPVNNSGKAKTVAAALAATRVQSSQPALSRNFQNQNLERNGRSSQNQRPAQRRKGNVRPPRHSHQMEDDIDPTSMLEVVTNIPSPSNSPRVSSNQYGYNNHRSSGNDYNNHGQGMDLTTTAPSSSQNTTTTTSTTTRLISKAMNKEYSFLNELGLVRKDEPSSGHSTRVNGYGLTHTASLENFVQNMLPRRKSPQATSSSTSSNSPPATDSGASDSDKTKNLVVEAYNFDPEISGDARAVARKFGLNVRVVMKWLKEGSLKSSPQSNVGYHENGLSMDNNNLLITSGMNGSMEDDEEDEYMQTRSLHKSMLMNESNNNSPGTATTTSVNKRKNSKPNQICDFPEDEGGFNGALDMVVPIKKRRVSSPNPTSQDA